MNTIKLIIFISCLFPGTIFIGCNSMNDIKPGHQKSLSKDSLQTLTIIDETINNTTYKLLCDSGCSAFLLIEDSSVITLRKPDGFIFDHERYKLLKKENFAELLIPLYDPTIDKFSESQQKILVKDNFLLFSIFDPMNYFGGYCFYIVFHKDNKLKNYVILPYYRSKVFEHKDESFACQAYFDIKNNMLVLESKLSLTSGPYLVSAYKIEEDTVRKLFEKTANRDSKYYKQMENKNAPFIYSRLLQKEVRKHFNRN
jgi:hypothetical protein